MLRFLATVAAVAAVSASDFNEKVRQCRSAPYMFSLDIVGKTCMPLTAFDRGKVWATAKDCSGDPSETIKWTTGGKCTASNVTSPTGPVTISMSYNGTSCSSGGSLKTYVGAS